MNVLVTEGPLALMARTAVSGEHRLARHLPSNRPHGRSAQWFASARGRRAFSCSLLEALEDQSDALCGQVCAELQVLRQQVDQLARENSTLAFIVALQANVEDRRFLSNQTAAGERGGILRSLAHNTQQYLTRKGNPKLKVLCQILASADVAANGPRLVVVGGTDTEQAPEPPTA